MSPDNQINELTRLFKENTHDENAVHMAQYMKGHFPFFGIKSTLRRDIQREWWQGHSIHSENELQSIIATLWVLDKREYQYVGLDLGKRYKKYFTPASILFIQKLITTKSWWDTVDTIASHMAGAMVFNYPETVTIMDEWIDHENMWIRRTAILHQLNFKDRTDPKRLFDYCKKRMNEPDFFIRKAVGWALRQYSYVDASAVIQFVKIYESEMSTLSKSEALKALKREGKI